MTNPNNTKMMTTRKISYYDYLVSFLIVDGYNIQ